MRSPKSDWRAIATFVVEFEEREGNGSALQRRTRIQHHEACVDQEWPGFAGDEVCHWMSARLARQLAASERATRAVAAAHRTLPGPAQPAPADLRIATVRLLRLEHPDRNVTLFERGRSAPGVVASRSSCAVEVMLEPAPGPRDAGGGSVAQIDGICLRAFNRDTGQSFELGRMQIGRHGPHPTACTLRMPLPAALAAGSYRVTCIPLTSGAALEPATVTLPLLQVV
ncbi:MAG: hypothetical protein N2688_02590 [Burkholderiaceae bacterium]|nr:hypothetical protein [Burkholderiaceae bacterium]